MPPIIDGPAEHFLNVQPAEIAKPSLFFGKYPAISSRGFTFGLPSFVHAAGTV
ncbi:MAG TPA: hypothetical protein VME41_17555 [Stellaceae bacterium]|nr:hypothetical protein [Stellaceae bacterium]